MSERFPDDQLPTWLRRVQPGHSFREYVEWTEALHFDWIFFNYFRRSN